MCFSNDRAIMLTIIMTLKMVDCYWPLSLDADFFRRYPGIPALHMITGLSLGRFDELLGPTLWVRGTMKWKNVFRRWGFDNAGEISDRIVVMGKSSGFVWRAETSLGELLLGGRTACDPPKADAVWW